MIINSANLKILHQAFKAAFNIGFRSHEPKWSKIATRVPSTAKEEKYAWLGQWPRLRKWIGDRQLKNLALHDYAIKNEPFESTVEINREEIEDDNYGVYTPLMQELGFAALTHPDELVFDLLKNGFAKTCYDGQYFFDTDHPVADGSVSNMQAGANPAWFLLDTSRSLLPLILQVRKEYEFQSMTDANDEAVFMRKTFRHGVDGRLSVGFGFWQLAFGSKATLDATNFDAAIAAGMAFKSDEGRPIGTNFNLLVVGPSNRAAAKALIDAERLANGGSNTNFKAVEVMVVEWLD